MTSLVQLCNNSNHDADCQFIVQFISISDNEYNTNRFELD